MTVWTFVVETDCDFAGIPVAAGSLIVVRPGNPAHPITVTRELPPNYGMLLNLMLDEAITPREPLDVEALAQLPERPDPAGRRSRRRHLRLER